MFGTEYNWLFETFRRPHGAPAVRLARTGLTTLSIAAFCLLCLTLRAEPVAPLQASGDIVAPHPAPGGIIEAFATPVPGPVVVLFLAPG